MTQIDPTSLGSTSGSGPLAGLSGSFAERYGLAASAGGGKDITIDSLAGRQQSFTQVLGREARRTLPGAKERAKETAQQFVASTLVEPILKQMRSSNQAPPPLGPSQGEKQFTAMMDTQIARNIVKRSHWGVVDRVADDLLKRSQGVTA